MKTITKIIADRANLSAGERMSLEEQIMERALTLWRKRGSAHLDALNAWLQAEREVLPQHPKSNILTSPGKQFQAQRHYIGTG